MNETEERKVECLPPNPPAGAAPMRAVDGGRGRDGVPVPVRLVVGVLLDAATAAATAAVRSSLALR
jgi:hypothetical protein